MGLNSCISLIFKFIHLVYIVVEATSLAFEAIQSVYVTAFDEPQGS